MPLPLPPPHRRRRCYNHSPCTSYRVGHHCSRCCTEDRFRQTRTTIHSSAAGDHATTKKHCYIMDAAQDSPKSRPRGLSVTDWERVQVKTFQNWVNSQLARRQMKLNNLITDLHDGVFLSELLEIISGKVIPHKKAGSDLDLRHKKIDNLSNAMKFVSELYKEAGFKVETSAEDIADCRRLPNRAHTRHDLGYHPQVCSQQLPRHAARSRLYWPEQAEHKRRTTRLGPAQHCGSRRREHPELFHVMARRLGPVRARSLPRPHSPPFQLSQGRRRRP